MPIWYDAQRHSATHENRENEDCCRAKSPIPSDWKHRTFDQLPELFNVKVEATGKMFRRLLEMSAINDIAVYKLLHSCWYASDLLLAGYYAQPVDPTTGSQFPRYRRRQGRESKARVKKSFVIVF